MRADCRIGGYLPEIDGLRGVAVLAVILFHFEESLLPAGFLGVDIFFVISGFVITRSLAGSRDQAIGGRLRRFFMRRVKRLLPALIVCLSLTAVAAAMIIPNPNAFFKTAMHAVFGLSNLSLYFEAREYFGANSQIDPFTQTWSLGVEEQFYLLFAGLIFIEAALRAPFRLILIGLSLVSFLLFITLGTFDPAAAFYLMPARFWELATGVLLAQHLPSLRQRLPILHHAAGPSLVCILVILCLPANFRTWLTIAIVVATAILIISLRKETFAFGALGSRPMVMVGRISYSLYLWHWSVITLGYWSIGITPATVPWLVLLILVLAVGSYRLIEQPLRHASWSGSDGRTILVGLGAAAGCLGFIAVLMVPLQHTLLVQNAAPAPPRPIYSKLDCHLPTSETPIIDCLNRENGRPHIFVMGDSHAGNLVPSLEDAAAPLGYVVRYLSDRALVRDMTGDYGCGGTVCADDEQAARFRFLASEMRDGDFLIFSMARDQLYAGDFEGASRQDALVWARKEKLNAALADMLRSVERLGARLVLVDDVPKLCSRKVFAVARAVGRISDCAVARGRSLEDRAPLTSVYREVADDGAIYLDPHDRLCEHDRCRAVQGGKPIYADASPHFTQQAPAPLTGFFSTWLREQSSHPVRNRIN